MITFKRSMLLLLSLISYNAQSLALGEEQREILYTLYEMGQDFASVPMIAQNIDMFIGVIEMEVQILTRKLNSIEQEFRSSLLYGLGWAGLHGIGTILTELGLHQLSPYIHNLGRSGIRMSLATGSTMTSVYFASHIYGASKERGRLVKLLELNKAVLEKLEEVKYMVAQNPQFMANPSIEALESQAANTENQVE